jgi:hypothetical protein
MIKKYVKKPVVIEAVKYDGTYDSFLEVQEFVGENFIPYYLSGSVGSIGIKTLEGNHEAITGDYIIKGVKGEFYPCKSDIFMMTYEEVKA